MTSGIIKVEVTVIGRLHYGLTDKTYQDLEYFRSQKLILITVLLYIVLKKITTNTLSQGT